jgi:hypothetical protein
MDPRGPKCLRCSRPFDQGDLAYRDQDEWLHVRCAVVLQSEGLVRDSRALKRQSEVRIAESQERVARYFGPADEPQAVLCIVCRTGIASVTELVNTVSGPMHVHCRHDPAA